MRFSKWIERSLDEVLNPELDRLKRDERMLVSAMDGRKGHGGAVYGINKAGFVDAMNKLKEVRAKIKDIEASDATKSDKKPIPAWIQSKRAV